MVFILAQSCLSHHTVKVKKTTFKWSGPISLSTAHPDSLQSLDLLVQPAVNIIRVEERVACNLAQEVPGKVADVVFAEVPLPQHSPGNHRLGVLVAALAKVAAEVFTVAQTLDVV